MTLGPGHLTERQGWVKIFAQIAEKSYFDRKMLEYGDANVEKYINRILMMKRNRILTLFYCS